MTPPLPPPCTPPVLGRFVFALNKFIKEEYELHHEVSDYWIYEFAKVRGRPPDGMQH